MHYVVFGAGAVGGVIGSLLCDDDHQVTLVARGAHLERIRSEGLLLRTPARELRVRPAAVETPAEVGWTPDTVVILTMKSNDTAAALEQLDASAAADLPVVCMQNGVHNERLALRTHPRVYAAPVLLPSSFLEPGAVAAFAAPTAGVLDVGCYPRGVDAVAEQVSADLAAAGFESRPDADVMALKYRKLLRNLANSVEAAAGPQARRSPLVDQALAEADAVLAAAGIRVASEAEEMARRGLMRVPDWPQGGRAGGSSWQSLARGTGRIEVDYLNGEIVLLGRLHGVATPVNQGLQRVVAELARSRAEAGAMSLDQLASAVAAASG